MGAKELQGVWDRLTCAERERLGNIRVPYLLAGGKPKEKPKEKPTDPSAGRTHLVRPSR